MKKLKISAVVFICLTAIPALIYLFWLYPKYTVPIINYHDFGYGEGIKVAPENFKRQMGYLKREHYKVIPLSELVDGIRQKKRFSRKTVVITMDDGYKDNFTYAYPVLKGYGFPATIFLIVNNIGSDPEFMDWDEVRLMAKNSISFGSHTKNHVYLPDVHGKDVLWDEIAGSKQIIQNQLGAPVDYLSYPKGGFTEEIKVLLAKAGYKAGLATNRGFDILDRKDMYELNRVSVRNRDNEFVLWAKLSGYYNLFKKRKPGD